MYYLQDMCTPAKKGLALIEIGSLYYNPDCVMPDIAPTIPSITHNTSAAVSS